MKIAFYWGRICSMTEPVPYMYNMFSESSSSTTPTLESPASSIQPGRISLINMCMSFAYHYFIPSTLWFFTGFPMFLKMHGIFHPLINCWKPPQNVSLFFSMINFSLIIPNWLDASQWYSHSDGLILSAELWFAFRKLEHVTSLMCHFPLCELIRVSPCCPRLY